MAIDSCAEALRCAVGMALERMLSTAFTVPTHRCCLIRMTCQSTRWLIGLPARSQDDAFGENETPWSENRLNAVT